MNQLEKHTRKSVEPRALEQACFTEAETSLYIGMSRSFLRRHRMEGTLKNRTPAPPFIKIGRNIRYLRSDLDAWLAKHRVDYHV